MIEIVCPSCEAHYQLPDGSIGPQGRKVSCSNCSHKWRAYPFGQEPAMEDDPDPLGGASFAESTTEERPAPEYHRSAGYTPAPEPDYGDEPDAEDEDREAARASIAESMAAISSASTETTGATEPAPAPGGRDEQMAAIRKMLADLKDSADAAPAPPPEPEAKPEPSGPAPVMRKRASEEHEDDDDRDPLKSRIENLTQLNRAVKGEPTGSGYSTEKLRRLHEKRAKKFQRQRERRKKSGGFLTGFTLVAMVTATMVGLYVLKPQIIAASPKMEPAMTEYVTAIDGYRVGLNEATAGYKDWLIERVNKLRGKAEEGQQQ